VIQVQQSTLDRRHDRQQPALALEQRRRRHILVLDREHVEGVEGGPLPAEQQLVEAGPGFEPGIEVLQMSLGSLSC
jgi:hypothetical protein